MYQILVVDDEPKIVELLTMYLEMQGNRVFAAYDGEQAWEIWNKEKIHLVLADIMMPKLDGYGLVERIRKESKIPILFLSAKTLIQDKIKGLSMGTDDYIEKPFDPLEVATRVSVNLRRCYGYETVFEGKLLTCKDLELDAEKCEFRQAGHLIELTAIEYRICRFLMENKGKVVTKNQIYEAAWEENQFPDDNSIMVAISKLRSKIKDDENKYIHTIRGLGYRMSE